MSGEMAVRQGIPLTLRLSKGERNPFFNGLLGHRTAESTCVYLCLAVEDLRGVALPLPKASVIDAGREEMP